jgi:hypothetical protein
VDNKINVLRVGSLFCLHLICYPQKALAAIVWFWGFDKQKISKVAPILWQRFKA